MEDPSFSSLTTPRLTLRRLRPSDGGALAAYRDDPDVARFQAWERPYSVDDARAFIERLGSVPPGRPGTWFQFAVCRRDDDALVGDLGLRTTAENSSHGELGFTFARAHQGHGYAREAVAAILRYVHEKLGMTRCFAVTDTANTRARHLLDRSGFDLEHELDGTTCIYGRGLGD